MSQYPIRILAGNPSIESIEVHHPHARGNTARALPDSPELEREMAAAFPFVQPTDEELQAEYERVLEDTAANLPAGYAYGAEHVPGGDGVTPRWEGYATRPDGSRQYAGWHFATEGDAEDAAILLAGRLAAEQSAAEVRTAFATMAAELSQDGGDDDPKPPTGAALYPECVTWPDTDLVSAIELADHKHPALKDHDALLHECSAELVRRLESSGVRFAA